MQTFIFSLILFFRLLDVIYSEKKLYLVFEYLSQDLKKYMDTAPTGGLSSRLVKVVLSFEDYSHTVNIMCISKTLVSFSHLTFTDLIIWAFSILTFYMLRTLMIF